MNFTGTTLLLAAVLTFPSCRTTLFGSFDYEDVNESRSTDQTYFEDSANVFFATYPNPYPDREFLWFATFVEGPVEMRVYDFATDTLSATYRFTAQDVAVHTIALHEVKDEFVKCVLFVGGRRKCAKLFPAFAPIPIPHWKTQYTVGGK
jgi:hypothetical protein